MTPKDKAKELMAKFMAIKSTKLSDFSVIYSPVAKLCALIAVDYIIDSSPRFPNDTDWDDCGATHQYYYEAQREEAEKYWKEVKQEIEKL